MKLQASLIILVMVVSVGVLGWVYTMASSGPAFQNRMLSESKIQQSAFYMESAKSSSVIAGQTAMYMALHENAQNGGINSYDNAQMEDSRYWFCNGNNVPDPEYINYFLSMKTREIVNSYLANMNTEDLEITPVTCVDYSLTETIATSNTMDFTADFYGSKITVFNPTETTSDNYFESTITDIPYWNTYNKFKDWFERNRDFNIDLCECIPFACDCEPQPGECTEENCEEFYTCLKEKMDAKVTEDLQASFNDDNVECSYTIDKCYMEQGVGDPNGDCGQTCHAWEDPPEAYANCYMPEEQQIDCGDNNNNIEAAGKISYEAELLQLADQCTGNCWDPQEERVSIISTVTCTDNNRNIPTGGESVPFTYSIKLWLAQKVGGACSGGQIPCTFNANNECTCESGGKACEDCRILGGGGGGVLIACENFDCSQHRDDCHYSDCTVDENGDPYCRTTLRHKCHCDPNDYYRWCDAA